MVVKKSTSKKMVKKTSRKMKYGSRKVSRKTMSKKRQNKTSRKVSRKTRKTRKIRGGDPLEKKAGVTAAMISGPSGSPGSSKALDSAKPITQELIDEQTKKAATLNITGEPAHTEAFRRSPPTKK